MCGIFGFVSSEPQGMEEARRVTDRLFRLSESRGKEASGLTILPTGENDLVVLRSPRPASSLIRTQEYRSAFRQALRKKGPRREGLALFGHTRLVTNGLQTRAENNQPVVYDGGIIVHNGIVVNVDELWAKNPDLKRNSEVDSEIIIALVKKYARNGDSPIRAVCRAFQQIRGTASVAIGFNDLKVLVLATNNGSLYLASPKSGGTTYFASESFILHKLLKSFGARAEQDYEVTQVPAQQGVLLDLEQGERFPFSLKDGNQGTWTQPALKQSERAILDQNVGRADTVRGPHKQVVNRGLEQAFERSLEQAFRLRRCSRCVLPETVPFIRFDGQGVCNYCLNYRKIELKGEKALGQHLARYRKGNGKTDCIAALSGGRDSCFGLHYLVREQGLKPITYTYDWGMVTDLARRNVSRVCSVLGIENIIISADIGQKRANIRKNVAAWLKKPHPGMIPLFMAGDKEFVWFAQRIKKQNDVELDIFCFNLLEKTQFKEEYSGTQLWRPDDADQLGEKLRMVPRLKLGAFYASQFLTNPAYLNRSVVDTFWGYIAYYFLPQTFISLFQYIPWKEDEVVSLLRKEFDWELAPDTASSWRIGDGTTGFYNYLYLVLGGFTENDTFRSNQIREGHLDRQTALELTRRDNQPRWQNIQWYFDVIQMDMADVLQRVHQADVHPLMKV